MIELIEKSLLAGVGALSLSQQKADEFLIEIKQRLNVGEEEGRALLDKFRATADESRSRLEEIAREEVVKAIKRMGGVTQDEFDKLKKKVSKLEKALKEAGN